MDSSNDFAGALTIIGGLIIQPETPPIITAKFPPNNATVDSLRPTLWGEFYDADRGPGEPRYTFQACGGTADAPVGCVNTGWIESSTWTVPAGMLSWGKVGHWYVAVYDGKFMTYLEGPNYFTPVTSQPEITHHLAAAEETAEPAGLNPQAGNYSAGVVDASIPVAGPPLEIRRTYNSQDPRGNGQSANLAEGRSATGGSVCSAAEGPEKAVNGSLADKWCSTDSIPELQVDLGAVHTIGTFVIKHAGAGGEIPAYNTRDFSIQTSIDGVQWTASSALNVVGNTKNVTSHPFTPRKVRYIKLRITTPASNGDTRARIYEFEAYGASNAFGPGWSTAIDQAIVQDSDGSESVVATMADGRQIRFGKNADGSYAPPVGYNITLVRSGTTWVLRDPGGDTRTFNDLGRLTTVVDAYGREQQYLYTNGWVSQIKDTTSGRSLYVTWDARQVSTIKADAPVAGGAMPTWNYTYTGYQLTKVCSPLSATSCVTYGYQQSSHYRSTVMDDNPSGYWPLSESAGGVATNVVARSTGTASGDASYSNVTLGATGALDGTTDKAATFTGSTGSAVVMQGNPIIATLGLSVELWFKAAPNSTGVLFGEQNTPLSGSPTQYTPALYVGTDLKLHGKLWSPTGGAQMVSTARVDDGGWHHVVLSVNVDQQNLYLDGRQIGQTSGNVVTHLLMGNAAFGNGWAAGWAAAPATGNFPFTGQIDDVAVYRHPLGVSQVAAHHRARLATARLTSATEPGTAGAVTTLQMTYDAGSGRVATLQDRNGAAWTVTQPVLGENGSVVTVAATSRDAVTYTYDPYRGGILTSRKTGAGSERWEYDANGFVIKYIDANGRERQIFHDTRGNTVAEATFRQGSWSWKEFGYYLNTTNPLDPRNDRMIWQSGTRNAWDHDATNRIVYELDPLGRTTKVTNPSLAGAAAPTETLQYTLGTETAVGGGTVPAGLVKRTTNKLGGATVYEYNAKGDSVRSTDPLGLITTFGYDLIGRNTQRTQSAVVNGQTVTYGTWSIALNAASLVTTETAPAVTNPLTSVTHTQTTTYTYDAAGHVTSKVLADTTGGDASRTWTYTFDAQNRPRTTTAPDGGATTQEWNTNGDVAKATQANGLVLEYRYDDFRHLVETAATGAGVDPLDANATRLVLESRAYDPAGQLAYVTDAMGRETAYTYHNDGRIETQKRVRRDAQGTITSTTTLAQYEYDYGGNVIRMTGPGGVVHDYDYDDGGLRNRDSIDPGGVARSTVSTYNAAGQVTSTRQTNGYTFLPGRSGETPFLLSAGGSQIDQAGSRYADNTATFTYKFALPADTSTAKVNLEIDNQYLVHVSADNVNWREVLRETRGIMDGSNRTQWTVSLATELATSKTIYVKVGDSRPADGWGGALSRVAMEYTRAGDKPSVTTSAYDLNGNPISTTVDNTGSSPAQLVTSTVRDPQGLPVRTVDPAGTATDITFDAVGKPVTMTEVARTVWRGGVKTDGLQPVTTFGHNTFGDTTQQRDAYGHVVTSEFDGLGRPTRTTLPSYAPPAGAGLTPRSTTRYAYDGKPTEQTDPLGNKVVIAYDKYGRIITRTLPDPDGDLVQTAPQWRYAYDRLGEQLRTTDPTGAQTTATFNDLGHQVTSTIAERVNGQTVYYTTTLGRDDAGRLTSVKTPLDHTTTTDYNQAGQPVKVTDPVNLVQEFRYNGTGAVAVEILAGARATSYTYDAAGRQTSMSDHTVTGGVRSAPLRTAQVSYDAAGRTLTTTSAEGRTTQYTYDAAGNTTAIAQRVDPLVPASAVTVQLGYDALGRQTRLVDGNGNVTETGHNSWGLPTTLIEPGTDATWTTVYDAAGRSVMTLAPGGVTTTRTYDGLGRLTAETGAGAEQSTVGRSFTYDATDRITRVSDPRGDTTYTWNDRGLQTGANSPLGNSTMTYDAEGNLISRTDASGTGTFGYDAAGRVTTITDALTPRVAALGYHPTGELATVNYGTGKPSRALAYDNLGRSATDTVKDATGAAVLSTAWTYDNDDLPKTRVTTGYTGGGSNSYGYDGLGRLTSWTRPDTQQITYGYDGASNLLTTTGPGGTRTNTYDTRNRLLTSTGGGELAVANTWTARGTLQSRTTGAVAVQFGSDAFDKNTFVQAPGYTTTYSYDALDRLVQRNGANLLYGDLTNNAVSAPTANGDAVIFRAPDGTAVSDKYGTDPGRLLITDPVHGDMVGAVGNLTGTVLATRSYDPYGKTTATSGKFTIGYQGGYTDQDTGFVNAHARWYDPATAAFTARDSLTLPPDPTAATNRYSYGNGSPLATSDPTGHCGPCVLVLAPIAGFFGISVGALAVDALGTIAAAIGLGYLASQWNSSCFNQGTPCGSGENNPYMDPSLGQVRSLVNAIGSASLYEEINRQIAAGNTLASMMAYIIANYATVPAVRSWTQSNGTGGTGSGSGSGGAGSPSATEGIGTLLASAPIIAAAAPVMQTPALPHPPEISLLPAGQQLINTAIGAGIAITIPSIMFADSDGSDASNPLLIPSTVNAMVNWYAQTAIDDLTGTNDPQCNEDETNAFLQGIVEWTAELVTSSFGFNGINDQISEAQWQAIRDGNGFPNPPMQRGRVIHELTAFVLKQMFPGQWHYVSGGKGKGLGPDYMFKPLGYKVELKSIKEFRKIPGRDFRDGDYQDCGWAAYDIDNKKD